MMYVYVGRQTAISARVKGNDAIYMWRAAIHYSDSLTLSPRSDSYWNRMKLPSFVPHDSSTYLLSYLPMLLRIYARILLHLPTYLPTCLPTYLPYYLPTYLPTYLFCGLTHLPSFLLPPTTVSSDLPSSEATYLPTVYPPTLSTHLTTYLRTLFAYIGVLLSYLPTSQGKHFTQKMSNCHFIVRSSSTNRNRCLEVVWWSLH